MKALYEPTGGAGLMSPAGPMRRQVKTYGPHIEGAGAR
ncbi:hypothetical protein FHS35_000103 [Streptomyces umbrinus]|nr:hypothetical protein [Streptomyces umbrinus]